MNLIQRIKAAVLPTQSDPGNKYNQSLFSYFNGIFFSIPKTSKGIIKGFFVLFKAKCQFLGKLG